MKFNARSERCSYSETFSFELFEVGEKVATASAIASGSHLYLHSFAVEKKYRGKGNGRRFYEEIKKFMTERGIKQICIPADYQAVGFWKRMGCEESGGSRDFEIGQVWMGDKLR